MAHSLSTTQKYTLAGLAAWEFIWKGLGMWRAGRNNQPGWFVAIMVLNTAGVLPIAYLLAHRKPGERKGR